MTITENERVIRNLYKITSNHNMGFPHQVRELLAMGCERFGLEIGILSNIAGENYRIVHQVSPESVPLVDEAEFNLPETYCAITLAENKPVFFEHVANSKIRNHPAYAAFALEAYFGVPVVVDGEVYGTLNFSSPFPRKRKFSQIDIDALQLMAIWIQAELSRVHYQKKILEQAGELAVRNQELMKMTRTDSLTEVGNRNSFYEELIKSLKLIQRVPMPMSIIMLDLDYFKHYNDSYGHIAGDAALKEIAKTVMRMTRSIDYVARYGGEEFIVMLPNTDEERALQTAERFRQAVNGIDTLECPLSSSFGVTTYLPGKERIMDYHVLSAQLIEEADKALYFAKDQGKNCVSFFSSSYSTDDYRYAN